jgi:hypothetical protein
MEYRSNEELYFSWFLDDLGEKGIVNRYVYEPLSFELSDQKWYYQKKVLVTKVNTIKKDLLEPHSYTPDFLVEWNESWDKTIYRLIDVDDYTWKPPFFAMRSNRDNKPYSFFETKPKYDQNNMTRLFVITRKWLYDKYVIYV